MSKSLFKDTGLHVLVDGQYGSTGKGSLAYWLAAQAPRDRQWWSGVISNAGPNSGHTFYHKGDKHVLKQLPTFAVANHLMGDNIPVFLSAGAIVDIDQLNLESEKYSIPIVVHPNATVVSVFDREDEYSSSIAAVAGTRSGAGAALARKVRREPDAVMKLHGHRLRTGITVGHWPVRAKEKRYFLEVSQGYSLGINQSFYPKVTSRECTVAQSISDAGTSPRNISRVYMSCRTYPIRVGNVDGYNSGGWYEDQKEISWNQIGVPPELTTVTQRPRRIATFSAQQMVDALHANEPDFVFMNFMNYLSKEERVHMAMQMMDIQKATTSFEMIWGYGPKVDDIIRTHPSYIASSV